MDLKELLKKEIAEFQRQIEARETALQALQRAESKSGSVESRFYQMRPLYAARILLAENGNKMKRTDLEAALLAGGIGIGRKRAPHNVRISLDLNIENGNLIKKGEYIILPDNS